MPVLDYPEGATPLDPDEAEGLLLTHITTKDQLNRWEQDNIVEAIAWLDRTKPINILNEQFIKELHKRMFCNVWKWAGRFRKTDKNIGGPWHQVPMALRNLCDDARVWVERKEESPEEIAVRLHHGLVSIHPFLNGNGRHARLMADILLENVMNHPRLSWGSRNLAKASDVRRRYIAALQAADAGDYNPLLDFAGS